MKDVKIFYGPDEICDFFRKRWKTDTFREEQDKPGSFIQMIIERVALYPLFTYAFSDHPSKETPDKEKTEWAHFGAWWGGITDREYTNPAIHDVYWLHEAYHKGFMTYEPGITFEGFKDKMFRNELNASMASEIELYMNYPELRKKTFTHEIFADRFLNDPLMRKRWQNDPWGTRDALRIKRKELMLRENKNDPVEYWIHKFAQQNEAWAAIWSRRYDQVETKMAEMHEAIDRGGARKEAMDAFMHWLQSPEVTRGTEIPFPDEAQAFAGVYRLNNRHYAESVARGDMAKNPAERTTSPSRVFNAKLS